MVEKNEMPVYVKIDDYKDVLEIISLIKEKLSEAKATMGKINDIKNEEDNELELWANEIEEVERKVEFVDNSLFYPEE